MNNFNPFMYHIFAALALVMAMMKNAHAEAAAPADGGFASLIPLILIMVIFYFLLIRPQAKEKQRHEAMLGAIKKGDEIVTNGGIIGKVVHVEEQRLTIKTGENTRLTVDRGRIAAVTDPKGPETGAKCGTTHNGRSRHRHAG